MIAQALEIDFYFAKPYHSWQRGSNENLNRLLKQYFQKGTDFDTIEDKEIKHAEKQINERQRKTYKFSSPIEMFNQKLHL